VALQIENLVLAGGDEAYIRAEAVKLEKVKLDFIFKVFFQKLPSLPNFQLLTATECYAASLMRR
jgi:hypothetical protein